MMRKVNAPISMNVKWVYERVTFYAPRISIVDGAATCSGADTEPVFRLAGIGVNDGQA